MQPIMDVFRTMRAMRRLKPDPVPKDLLERVVAAATWAPGGGDLQLYDFIVVTDRAQVARLGALWREVESKYMAHAGARIPRGLHRPGCAGAP
jgi:nitroreductase